jgi:hypothetical protein
MDAQSAPGGVVTDELRPDADLEGSGRRLAAFGGPVRYEAYERDGMRHGWTVNPDGEAKYHALTLQWQEQSSSWAVTAAQPYDSLDAARAWAERLARETEGTG